MEKKPDVRYVDMCIYIDKHMYEDSRDEKTSNTCYLYMYHLLLMLANKSSLFHNKKDYEDFATYAAGELWLRYTDSRQFTGEKTGNGTYLKKITSVLNYIKSGFFIKMQNSWRAINYKTDFKKLNDDNRLNDYLDMYYATPTDELEENIIEETKYLPKIIKRILNESPFKNDKIIYKNLYMSCLLSFLSSITLCNQAKARITKTPSLNYGAVARLYNKEKSNCIILWHLDESFRDYVQLHLNLIQKQYVTQITRGQHDIDISNQMMQSMMIQSNTYERGIDD